MLPFASGTALQLPSATKFSTGQRYATIHEFVPGIAREHFINGLHIHVHIPDAAAGVRALNALRAFMGFSYGPLTALYAELVPARIRLSGSSISYALGSALGGAFAPTIAAALVGKLDTRWRFPPTCSFRWTPR
ncbi:glutamate-cysteine ligase family protein [Glutamicibacter mysorens]|uniref:glutamate-cysteine ligase family protein n=1 Tax=Glutamicibacter mysorens TaxID=257984 RepID=UPI003F5B5D70